MARLRGTGLGVGMALGTAAVVRLRGGFPMLPQMPPQLAALTPDQRISERPDVILVTEDYQAALALQEAFPWGQVVGIIAGKRPEDSPVPSVPAVVDIPYLPEGIEDEQLILVDAGRGLVLVDPDGMAIARYQAEHDNIAPKRRLFLDEGHLPARTMDGRNIQVVARVLSASDAELALEDGADALFVPFNSFLLPADADEETLRDPLFSLLARVGGKSLILADDYAFPLTLILEAASRADLTLAVPPRNDLEGGGIEELQRELNATAEELLENDVPYAMPRLAVHLTRVTGQDLQLLESLAVKGMTRLIVDLQEETLGDALLAQLEPLIAVGSASLLPVIVATTPREFPEAQGNEDEALLAVTSLIGAGASGLLVEPDRVAIKKSMVSELVYSECREELMQRLHEPGSEG